MAKKIAAPRPMRAGLSSAPPRKAARKAPVRTKTAPKEVTAPVRHRPKGSPKERLAYLNKGEMAALEKRKGSPARRGPKGLPSFADDSASSKGVSRGDSSGTKGSGSTKTSSGSVSKGGSYNSGTSGSRGGGASTQSPGMGRNEGRVGPSSPMGGQGRSFSTPKAARDDSLRRAYGIEDQRGLRNMPQRPYFDRTFDATINPNLPPVDREKGFGERRAYEDRVNREQAALKAGRYRNPREIRSISADLEDAYDKQDSQNASKNLKKSPPLSQEDFRTNVGRAGASGRLPDIKLGGPREGTLGGYSGGGMGGTYRGGGWGSGEYSGGRGGQGWKAGGLVKKNSNKSFKKK
jgi:hypothetical protein